MVEADIHLRPLHTSILDVYKVFEPLVCCLNGIWFHPHTITPAKLSPDLGIEVHLRSGNNAKTPWSRLILTSDHFLHPYLTYKVFETLVCSLKGILVHPYTVTPSKFFFFFSYKINELFQLDSTRLSEHAPGSEEEGEGVWCQECRVR